MTNQTLANSLTTPVCPACRGELLERAEAWTCLDCARTYPAVAGLADLRLESDRYLDLAAERAKAERLHALEPETDLRGLAEAYYAMTDDVLDARRGRFLRHIAGAEARPMVNWDVVSRNARSLTVRVRQQWDRLTSN